MRWTLFALAFISLPIVHAQSKKDPKPKLAAATGEPMLTTPSTLGLFDPGVSSVNAAGVTITLAGTNFDEVNGASIFGSKLPVDGVSLKADQKLYQFIFQYPHPTEPFPETLMPTGLYQLRLKGKSGLSAFRPIVADHVQAVEDNGANDTVAKAQPIELNRTVIGAIANETADYYRFKVKAGQTVTFDCFAKRLGSALDPMIVLYDAKTGREYPSLAADDTPGLQTDARLVHTFPADGEYAIAVRDTTYKGGEAYRYRLRVTVGPAAMMVYPPFATKGEAVSYSFLSQNGVAIPSRVERDVPPRWLATVGESWPVPVWPHDGKPTVEAEPNNDIKTANALPPGGMTARFEQKKDRDLFSFAAKKGEVWSVVARAAEIGSPCETLITIRDEKGTKLAESDPMKPTARAEFTAKEDGTYFADCEPLNFQHGPFEVYHVRAAKVEKSFTAIAGMDRVAIPTTGFGLLPIIGIERKNGFEGPVTIAFKTVLTEIGTPRTVEGTVTIAGTSTKENPAYLPIRAERGVYGLVAIPNVSAAEIVRTGLNGLPHLPPGWGESIAMTRIIGLDVGIKSGDPVTVKAGAKAMLKFAVDRKKFDGDITLSLLGLPANVTAKPVTLAKGSTEAPFEIVVDTKSESIVRSLFVKAEAGGLFTHAGPVELTIVKADEKPMPAKPTAPIKK